MGRTEQADEKIDVRVKESRLFGTQEAQHFGAAGLDVSGIGIQPVEQV